MRPSGVFVTGTDTEVGKTVVASAIAATLAVPGRRVSVFKPVVTGLADLAGLAPDHERLRAAARATQQEWEVAAEDAPASGGFLESRRFHPAPAGEARALTQLFGETWQWTQSAYSAYQGYQPLS